MKLTCGEIVEVLDGLVLKEYDVTEINGVETDTRRLNKHYVFFALKGERVNGNDLLKEAVENGAEVCIVDEERGYFDEIEGAKIIKVDNCREALCKLASYYRMKFDLKVVGITGSTGKTSTKDILAASLGKKYNVFKTIGNFNSDIGLPLMIFKFEDMHDIAILEMGMSGFGEIKLLAEIAKPDMAIITNVGTSHLEHLKTRENILKAKMEIVECFNEENLLIVNNDNDLLKTIKDCRFRVCKCGSSEDADIWGEILSIEPESLSFEIKSGEYTGEDIKLNIPGAHNMLNSLLCFRVCQELHVDIQDIKDGLSDIDKTSMRLDIHHLKKSGAVIINDAYNASPDSMEAAIKVVSSYKDSHKVCVLGTMKELGEESAELHRRVGEFACENQIDEIYVTGEFSKEYSCGFGKKRCKVFDSKEKLAEVLKNNIKNNWVVLIKASRSLKFESIFDELLKK